MEFFRQWLMGVVACALLVSMAAQLCPQGNLRALTRFTGGMLILCAMLRPLTALELPEIPWSAENYRAAVAQLELELTEENAFLDGIAAELASYIEDKADSLDANVQATVTVALRGGVYVPSSVTLRGRYNEALADFVEEKLGVAKEEQRWIEP